jgi:hypothetical protein
MIAFVSLITALIVLYVVVRYCTKLCEQGQQTVELKDNKVSIKWKDHTITFVFKDVDGVKHYCGAECNEKYSCSISSTYYGLPWKIWAKCGNDEITITTDLISEYKIR